MTDPAPPEDSAREARVPLNGSSSSASTARPLILVVDDNEGIRQVLHALLTRNGYATQQAADGAAALSAAQALPDLILMDIMLPEMDGFAVYERLRADPATRDIPVIFLTALNNMFEKIKGFSTGGVDYIIKPFHTQEVLMRVQSHLTIRTLQKRLEEKNRALMQEIEERKKVQEELTRLAILDPLTGLHNRRYFFEAAAREFTKARRYHRPLSVILLDVDNFKAINDTYGHAVGDQVLVRLGGILKENLRSADVLARYGGEEFILLLPETNLPNTLAAAERIRNQVACSPLPSDGSLVEITVSLGIADVQSCPDDCSFDHLLIYADRALYAAKHLGRNRVAAHAIP